MGLVEEEAKSYGDPKQGERKFATDVTYGQSIL